MNSFFIRKCKTNTLIIKFAEQYSRRLGNVKIVTDVDLPNGSEVIKAQFKKAVSNFELGTDVR